MSKRALVSVHPFHLLCPTHGWSRLRAGTPPCAGAGAAEAALPLQVRAEGHALGGARFGAIWRLTSPRAGVCCRHPALALAEQPLASPISSLCEITGRKVTAVKIQKHLPPRGFAGATVASMLLRGGLSSKKHLGAFAAALPGSGRTTAAGDSFYYGQENYEVQTSVHKTINTLLRISCSDG